MDCLPCSSNMCTSEDNSSSGDISISGVGILTSFSFIGSGKASSVVYRQITERYNDLGSKDYNSLLCSCSNNSVIEKDIDRVTGSEILTGNLNCSIMGDICDKLHDCTGCIVYSEICLPSVDQKNFECESDVYMLNEDYFRNKDFKNSKLERNRLKRDLKTCEYPSHLKTADLHCKVSLGKVKCSQTCILGYTLKEGRKMDYECKSKINKWTPSKFKECEPYVDCTISLISAGSADCYTPTTKSPAMCYISCDPYEDKTEVPRRSYTCNENGEWRRKLPFCAKAGTNLAVVDPPL